MFVCLLVLFFFKQKTAYEMRISDWSSDVCSSDLCINAWINNFHICITVMCLHRAMFKSGQRGAYIRQSFKLDISYGKSGPFVNAVDDLSPREIGRASCRERVCQYV